MDNTDYRRMSSTSLCASGAQVCQAGIADGWKAGKGSGMLRTFAPRPAWCLRPFGFLLAISACGPASDDTSVEGPVCPLCKPSSGGQTSDFDGGSTTACSLFLERQPADASALAERGIDLSEVESAVTREFDVPLHLEPGDARDSGASVSGYERTTRLVGRTTPLFHEYLSVNETLCDGQTCRNVEGTLDWPEQDCRDQERLETRYTAHLRTTDGSFEGDFTGVALLMQIEPHPFGSALADIRDVTGTLRLTIPDKGRYTARLRADLYFHPDEVNGWFGLDLARFDGDGTGAQYLLLDGTFPEQPTAPTEPGSFGPDIAAEDP